MADLFRSAFSYIQQAAPIRQGNFGIGTSHPLVGTSIDVGGIKVKLRSLLAEGGFGLVFSAEDSQGNLFALKRLLASDKEAADAAIREIKFQKELSGPPSIVKFVSAATRNPEQTSHGRAEFLLLTELCSGGPLIDLLQKGPISPENIFKIFYAVSSAVKHMHDRNQPVTHRDIKIENLLFTSDGFVKLCDFGSATTEVWRPDDNWNALKRSLLEEEMQRHTTPMYRAPEILDTYQNYPIGPSQDVWALGCILFYLCYRTHPFEDSAKLRIINAKFTLPEEKTAYSGFHPIIRSLLQPNPHLRPSIQELCDQLEQLAYHLKIDFQKPITGVEFERRSSPSTPPQQLQSPSETRKTNIDNTAAVASEMFSQLKGQGLSIFKNIREKSAAVVQTVQTNYISKEGTSEAAPPRPPPPMNPDRRSVPLVAPGLGEKSSTMQSLDNPFQSAGSAPKQEEFADFFSTLDWSSGQQQQQQQQNTFHEPAANSQTQKFVDDDALDWERKAGIRINHEEEDEDAHLYKFDYEKKSTPSERRPQAPKDDTEKLIEDLDELLDFTGNSKSNIPSMAPSNNFLDDIFSSSSTNSMHRNVSAPSIPNSAKKNEPLDHFADMKLFKPQSEHGSGRSTPLHNPAAGLPPMDRPRPKNATGAKGSGDIFADLLADHGITEKKKSTMGDMLRTEEEKFLDPVSIKVRKWTQNKNGNIRALLSSLDEVLWPEAGNWTVSITDMLNDNVVKKVYFKACLLVHPDKQVGQPHHSLSQAIFTELNKAMVAFENDKK